MTQCRLQRLEVVSISGFCCLLCLIESLSDISVGHLYHLVAGSLVRYVLVTPRCHLVTQWVVLVVR